MAGLDAPRAIASPRHGPFARVADLPHVRYQLPRHAIRAEAAPLSLEEEVRR